MEKNLFTTKSISKLLDQASADEHSLKRTLGPGNLVALGIGAVIGAGAIIEDDVFIGTSAVIVGGVQIGKGASVGAGSVVIENVPAKARVFGNPAQKM